ncbi:MAG: GNAT family N-acetyltransferase [Gemmatimonadales bacterium]
MKRTIVTTHLELTDPGQLVPAGPARVPHAIARVEAPSPELGRFLYTAVGGRWHWTDRLSWSRRDWVAHFERPGAETWMMVARGGPAGFFELAPPDDGGVEIAMFGLLPEFIGEGLGGNLLSAAVRRVWESGAHRVWLHTCSLDHPSALAAYRARGFREFARVESEREVPDQPPEPWPGANR